MEQTTAREGRTRPAINISEKTRGLSDERTKHSKQTTKVSDQITKVSEIKLSEKDTDLSDQTTNLSDTVTVLSERGTKSDNQTKELSKSSKTITVSQEGTKSSSTEQTSTTVSQQTTRFSKITLHGVNDTCDTSLTSVEKTMSNTASMQTTPLTKQTRSLLKKNGPEWRCMGTYEDMRRVKCRRIHAKIGSSKDLALFHEDGKFYAMGAWCSHMGGPLFQGQIEDYKGTCHVMCPWHAYMFDLKSGRNELGLEQDVFPVKVENGHVYIQHISELSLNPYL